jgi:putative flippase GtrA
VSVNHRKPSLLARAWWYALAGVVTIVVNPALFALFHEVFGWHNYVAYALSLALVNVLHLLWNYYVGFRPSESLGTSARRQVMVYAGSNGLNYVLVVGLQSIFPQWNVQIIVVVQTLLAGSKFLAYHYWVYPHQRG